MDKNIKKEMEECKQWKLQKGTIIHYGEFPYYLGEDVVIYGNSNPSHQPEFQPKKICKKHNIGQRLSSTH